MKFIHQLREKILGEEKSSVCRLTKGSSGVSTQMRYKKHVVPPMLVDSPGRSVFLGI
jgi:hypothetical protein